MSILCFSCDNCCVYALSRVLCSSALLAEYHFGNCGDHCAIETFLVYSVEHFFQIKVNIFSSWFYQLLFLKSCTNNMAQQLIMKSRPLGKDEVLSLLDLISKHSILTSKATNATNNKLKEEAWKSIAQDFSAMTGEIKRPEQLRLKWENLKKAARKRNALIRQNNIKTGGGKTYIPPDEALDRVASMLGALCSGFTVEFGGDREELVPPVAAEVQNLEILDSQPLAELEKDENVVAGSSGVEAVDASKNFMPKKFLFNTPKSGQNKRRKLSEDLQRAQCEKELAMAAYFRAKAEKVELESVKLKLEIEQLKKC